jgi:hypothetical protein
MIGTATAVVRGASPPAPSPSPARLTRGLSGTAPRARYSGSEFSRYTAWMTLVAFVIGPNHFS